MNTIAPRGQFYGAQIPDHVLDMKICPNAKLLYALLCNYAGHRDYCWPSQQTLAERLACSVSSIRNYLKILVRHGLIFIESVSKDFRTAKYFILRHASMVFRSVESAEVAAKACSATSAQSAPALQSVRSPHPSAGKAARPADPTVPAARRPVPLVPAPSVAAAPVAAPSVSPAPALAPNSPDFQALWNAYPEHKQIKKGAAISAWNTLLRAGSLPSLAVMMEALEKFKASEQWTKEEGRFVPALCRWLEDMRWLDGGLEAGGRCASSSSIARQVEEITRKQSEKAALEKQNFEERKQAHASQMEAFAARFPNQQFGPCARGQWLAMAAKGHAPLADDVPLDNTKDIIAFLKQFDREQLEKDIDVALNLFIENFPGEEICPEIRNLYCELYKDGVAPKSKNIPEDYKGKAVQFLKEFKTALKNFNFKNLILTQN